MPTIVGILTFMSMKISSADDLIMKKFYNTCMSEEQLHVYTYATLAHMTIFNLHDLVLKIQRLFYNSFIVIPFMEVFIIIISFY